jgi:hypothetical protein
MKKIFLAILATSLMSGVAFATDGGGKQTKKAKAKTECTKKCPDCKDCNKDGSCPDKKGCVCH